MGILSIDPHIGHKGRFEKSAFSPIPTPITLRVQHGAEKTKELRKGEGIPKMKVMGLRATSIVFIKRSACHLHPHLSLLQAGNSCDTSTKNHASKV